MRLLGLLVIIAVFCVAHNPFKFIPLSLDPSDGAPWIVNPLALLLREQYTKALSILSSTYHSPVKNTTTSHPGIQPHHFLNGAIIGNRDLANKEKTNAPPPPNQIIINSLSPIPTSPATSETYEHHQNSPSTSSIAQLSDSSAGTNGTSTAGNSASAKLNALGAMLVFVGAAFALL